MNRFGEEAGLPLFESQNKAVPKHVQKRLESAPKAIEVATETRNLAEMIARSEPMNLAEKQQTVLDTMYLRDDWTNEEIARKLGWGINRVTGRVYELRQLGLVVTSLKRSCDVTGMIVQAWRVK